ncbi:PREDICTED: uncharacterized protein LOC104766833 [Camelina sativa]|uniref:Uncharacterized protein LOC104766833 n=1 Tax=Camelina sativa TaxID=90675 RepID=A0ABM0XPU4_CAMSA|nr:PREDICTED: uncharacterized protein LOC104766833 [Camelina sativa]
MTSSATSSGTFIRTHKGLSSKSSKQLRSLMRIQKRMRDKVSFTLLLGRAPTHSSTTEVFRRCPDCSNQMEAETRDSTDALLGQTTRDSTDSLPRLTTRDSTDALPRLTTRDSTDAPGREAMRLDRHATWTRSQEEASASHSTDHAKHPTSSTSMIKSSEDFTLKL